MGARYLRTLSLHAALRGQRQAVDMEEPLRKGVETARSSVGNCTSESDAVALHECISLVASTGRTFTHIVAEARTESGDACLTIARPLVQELADLALQLAKVCQRSAPRRKKAAKPVVNVGWALASVLESASAADMDLEPLEQAMADCFTDLFNPQVAESGNALNYLT